MSYYTYRADKLIRYKNNKPHGPYHIRKILKKSRFKA